jgi:hypothetical protein
MFLVPANVPAAVCRHQRLQRQSGIYAKLCVFWENAFSFGFCGRPWSFSCFIRKKNKID